VITSEPDPQLSSTEPVPPQAEEVSAAAAVTEASIVPPLSAPIAAVEGGEMATEAHASRVTLVMPTKAGPSGEDTVVVLDEDSAAPPSLENHDVMIEGSNGDYIGGE
jgi:hypothetical protein